MVLDLIPHREAFREPYHFYDKHFTFFPQNFKERKKENNTIKRKKNKMWESAGERI